MKVEFKHTCPSDLKYVEDEWVYVGITKIVKIRVRCISTRNLYEVIYHIVPWSKLVAPVELFALVLYLIYGSWFR